MGGAPQGGGGGAGGQAPDGGGEAAAPDGGPGRETALPADGSVGGEIPSGSACPFAAHAKGARTQPLMKSKYEIYVPASYDPSRPTPLVIGLHGTTQDGPMEMKYCGLRAAADKQGFLAVAPTGWEPDNQFLYDICGGGTDVCQKDGEADFMNAMIDTMSECYNVDRKHVYMFGFSQGGFFSTFFCLKYPTKVAACGAHGAGCYSGGPGGHCDAVTMAKAARKVPFFVYVGANDKGYNDSAKDLDALLGKHGYPKRFTEKAGLDHNCDPGAVIPQWEWWQAQPALP